MGGSLYSVEARTTRSLSAGYQHTHANDATVFRQAAKKCVNEGMDPSQISLREARDSDVHPVTVPIVLQLDETGSMGRIPVNLVKGDLPHLMSDLIEGCCPDAALLFMGVGDIYSDKAPLQIGQFESGDAELDHWLTSVYLEGNGGNNDGESYSLGWLFAMNMIQTDAWEKRGQKGLFISVGDEPLHPNMPVDGLKKIFGRHYDKVVEGLEHGANVSAKQVLDRAKEKWNFHHIHLGNGADNFLRKSWEGLGEGFHAIGREENPLPTILKICCDHMASLSDDGSEVAPQVSSEETTTTPSESIPDPV